MNLGVLSVLLNAQTTAFRKQFAASNATLMKFAGNAELVGKSVSKLGSRMTMLATLPILAGGALSTKAFAGFEQSMRDVNTIAKQTEEEFKKTSQTVLQFSKNLGVRDPNEMAKALYNINSASFKAAEGLTVLDASMRAGRAGLASTDAAAKAITSILNAYRKEASEATDVSDMLFRTVEKGVVTFPELADVVGTVAGTASALKIEFDEVAAAIATMTRGGINAHETVTSLNRLMMRFLKTSPELKAMMNAAGFASAEAMFKVKGLAGSMEWLNDVTGGSAQKLSDLGFMIRDLKAALKLTGDQAQEYQNDLAEIADKSVRAGATQAALDQQMKSLQFTLDKAVATFKVAAIRVGELLAPAVLKLANNVIKAVEWWEKLDIETKKNVGTFLKWLAVLGPILFIVGKIISAVGKLAVVFVALKLAVGVLGGGAGLAAIGAGVAGLAGPIGLFVAAISAAAFGVGALIAKIKGMKEVIKETAVAGGESMQEMSDDVDTMVKKYLRSVEGPKKVGMNGAQSGTDLYDDVITNADANAAQADYMKALEDAQFERMDTERKLVRLTEKRRDLEMEIANASGEGLWQLKQQAVEVESELLRQMDEFKEQKLDKLKESFNQQKKAPGAAEFGSVEAYRLMHADGQTKKRQEELLKKQSTDVHELLITARQQLSLLRVDETSVAVVNMI